MFTDRILLFSTFAAKLLAEADAEVWISSYPANMDEWAKKGFTVKPFPQVNDFRERINLLRAINHEAWAHKVPAPSILTMRRFNQRLNWKRKRRRLPDYFPDISYVLGRLIAAFGLHRLHERNLFKKMSEANRSEEAYNLLKGFNPDLVVSTNPMWMFEAAVCIEAQKLNLPVYSFIPSWDNITTKSRFTFVSYAYGVWSDIRALELRKYFPYSASAKVYSTGAPQYDVFFMEDYLLPRQQFFKTHNLNPELPVVLYTLGSPLFIKSEFPTAVDVLKLMRDMGMLQKVQVLVRPHPNKDNWDGFASLFEIHPNIKVQDYGTDGLPTVKRSQTADQIADWVSTIYYSDVVVSASSTILLDAALFDKPAVNIEFDSTPEKVYDEFLLYINKHWPHLVTVTESKAVYSVFSAKGAAHGIFAALLNANEKHSERVSLRKIVLNNEDGRAGERFAESVLQTALELKRMENGNGSAKLKTQHALRNSLS
jgi:hypothetical protein